MKYFMRYKNKIPVRRITMEWLKKAVKTTEANSQEARETVASMLQEIRAGGEPAVSAQARK